MNASRSRLPCSSALLVLAFLATACGGSSGGGEGTSDIIDSGGLVIGDTGPNGGTIFFVDNNDDYTFSYLEAAPNRISFRVGPSLNVLFMWASTAGGAGYSIPGTSDGIGAGQQNTNIVANSLTSDGQNGRAVHLALDYDQGSCEWFLPSKDELNLMYVNLIQPALVSMPGGLYWSSTQASAGHAWAQSMSSPGGGFQSSLDKGQANQLWPICAH
ncbi:DUF1566 domain-containing protein [Isoalcanivorax indicus]|uniref:DUF1566 domain-containing protein n=1 Tax=Isoalcanivorax indicus TaxID=2202653 RepID=UPI000DBA1CFD|nr:DUF1566 domain-containing protein [Isoalcanivorax indicus]